MTPLFQSSLSPAPPGPGKIIAAAAAQQLKRVHLGLGGNSALIVLADVDVEKAVWVGAFGSFNHAGQNCMATSRHLVAASIAPHYGAVLAERADRITVGDPTDPATGMGPIIDAAQRDNIHRIVTSSVDAGATLAAGGTYAGAFRVRRSRLSVGRTDRRTRSESRHLPTSCMCGPVDSSLRQA